MPNDPRESGDVEKTVDDEALVVTPAGLAKKKNVHPVGPREKVRRNPDGSYSVVDRKK